MLESLAQGSAPQRLLINRDLVSLHEAFVQRLVGAITAHAIEVVDQLLAHFLVLGSAAFHPLAHIHEMKAVARDNGTTPTGLQLEQGIRELRAELSNRAAENVKSEVKLREVETELSVAQASTDLLATGVLDYSVAPDGEEDDGEIQGDPLTAVT